MAWVSLQGIACPGPSPTSKLPGSTPVLGSKLCVSVVLVCGVLNLIDREQRIVSSEQTFVHVYDCLLFTGTKIWDRDRCKYPLGNVKRLTWIWKAEFLLLGDRSRLTGTCNSAKLGR